MEKKVQQYLQRKGFRLTELALQEERNRLSTSVVSDVTLARSDNDPGRYHDGYSRLRTWAYSSLDQYKFLSIASWISWQRDICRKLGHFSISFGKIMK